MRGCPPLIVVPFERGGMKSANFGNGKCELRQYRFQRYNGARVREEEQRVQILDKEKYELTANFSATMVIFFPFCSAFSVCLSVSLSLSLSLSPSAPHAQYAKCFRT